MGQRRRKVFQIDSIEYVINFRRRVRTSFGQQLTAVVCFHGDERGRRADLGEKLIVPEIDHEILSMGGDAKGDSRNLFQKQRGGGGAIGEVQVKMIDARLRKELREIEGVACALGRFVAPAVFFFVTIDKCARPFPMRLCVFLPNSKHRLWWGVADWRAQPRSVGVSQSRKWRVNRTDFEGETQLLQSQHFRVAKCLRDDRIAGVEITEPQES